MKELGGWVSGTADNRYDVQVSSAGQGSFGSLHYWLIDKKDGPVP
jgi:hypothetical protein